MAERCSPVELGEGVSPRRPPCVGVSSMSMSMSDSVRFRGASLARPWTASCTVTLRGVAQLRRGGALALLSRRALLLGGLGLLALSWRALLLGGLGLLALSCPSVLLKPQGRSALCS